VDLTLMKSVNVVEQGSAYQRLINLRGLYSGVLDQAKESPLSADERSVLIAVAQEISTLTESSQYLFSSLADILRQVDHDDLKRRYEKLFETDKLDPRVHDKLKEVIERYGGIREFAQRGPEAVRQMLEIRREELRRDVARLEAGDLPDSPVVDFPSDDSLFEGGVALIVGGAAIVALAATAPVSVPVAFAVGFIGGTLIGGGGISMAFGLDYFVGPEG
jgi:hypothetical protein